MSDEVPLNGQRPNHISEVVRQGDAFAGLTASDEIFLDSYHFGDRGNAIVAKKIATGIHASLTQGAQ